LTNAAGTVTDTVIYDAWGNIVSRTGTTAIVFLWVGVVEYYFDVETGQIYIRERTYRAMAGGWTSVDPRNLRFPGRRAMSGYCYAGNNPLLAVDPSGLLSYKLVPIVRNVQCRQWGWSHDWVLDGTEQDGFILQRNVAWDFGIECGCKHWFRSSARCPPKQMGTHIVEEVGCPNVVSEPGNVDAFEFWELWVVEKGVLKFGKPPALTNVGELEGDKIGMVLGFDACGQQKRTQYAYWYDGGEPPGGWEIWQVRGGIAGLLAWTCGNVFPVEIEAELEQRGAAVTKETTRTFCCCPSDPDQKLDRGTATANGQKLPVD
jgi:RHS repeat-associated protein